MSFTLPTVTHQCTVNDIILQVLTVHCTGALLSAYCTGAHCVGDV